MKLVFLRDEDRRRIEAAVCEAERRTTAELVTVIADASGGYHYMPTLLAAAAVFVLSGLALLLPIRWEFAAFYAAQVFLFIGLALTLNWRPVRFRIVPRSVQRRQAHLLAHEQFLDLGLSSTAARTGLMLFVSAAEHYVEIIADRGIREKVDDTAWGGIVDNFIAEVRAARITDGFVHAIEACTEILAREFPWHEGDKNEIPNQVIQISLYPPRHARNRTRRRAADNLLDQD
ncbi:MAG: TPM domain-containing protein [Rhodospirillales bacterium]